MHILLATMLLLFCAVSAQAQRVSAPVSHTITVKIYVPDGVVVPQVIKVELLSDRSGQPLQLISLMRGENTANFYNIANGEYAVVVTPDRDSGLEPAVERFSLRNNFPILKQLSIFLSGRVTKGRVVVGTVDAAQLNVPKDARKAFERGMEKAVKGKQEEAVKAFEEAVSIYPDYFEALNNLVVHYIEMKRFDRAKQHLSRAMQLAPESPLPYLNLGILLIEQRFYREAAETLEHSLKLDSTNPLTHYQLGLAYFQAGDLQSAQKQFEFTVEHAARKIPLARLYLADIYKKLERTEDACTQIEHFLRETPDNPFTEVARKELSSLKQKK